MQEALQSIPQCVRAGDFHAYDIVKELDAKYKAHMAEPDRSMASIRTLMHDYDRELVSYNRVFVKGVELFQAALRAGESIVRIQFDKQANGCDKWTGGNGELAWKHLQELLCYKGYEVKVYNYTRYACNHNETGRMDIPIVVMNVQLKS